MQYHSDLEKWSEQLACDTTDCLATGHVFKNDRIFGEMSYVPEYYKFNKDVCNENTVLFPESSRLCDKEVVKYRGQNNVPPQNLDKKNNFLVQPSKCGCGNKPNTIECNGCQCCQRCHKMFLNNTKRK